MHLIFDILINGEYALKRAVCFYIFAYRVSKRFAAADLMDRVVVPENVGKRPIHEFFTWRPLIRKQPPTALIESASSATQDRSAP